MYLQYRVAAAAFALAASTAAAVAGCASLRADFDRAITERAVDRAKQVESAIKVNPACFSLSLGARIRRVALQVELASDPGMSMAERDALLSDAEKVPDAWLAAWKLADLRMQQRQFADAVALYDEAIVRAGDPAPFSEGEKRKLLKQAGAAKNLAGDDRGGARNTEFPASTRGPDGTVGGVFSPVMRAIKPIAVPLPINFETDSATMTPNGNKAADELLKAIKEQNVTEVTLVGHTDERGADDYNMQLSLTRVNSVAAYLKQHLGSEAANIRFNLVAKGKREPFDVSVLSFQPSQEETWALDRRVDWLR